MYNSPLARVIFSQSDCCKYVGYKSGKVTDIKNYKNTYLLKYLRLARICLVSEINIYNQIFGTITNLSQTLKKL